MQGLNFVPHLLQLQPHWRGLPSQRLHFHLADPRFHHLSSLHLISFSAASFCTKNSVYSTAHDNLRGCFYLICLLKPTWVLNGHYVQRLHSVIPFSLHQAIYFDAEIQNWGSSLHKHLGMSVIEVQWDCSENNLWGRAGLLGALRLLCARLGALWGTASWLLWARPSLEGLWSRKEHQHRTGGTFNCRQACNLLASERLSLAYVYSSAGLHAHSFLLEKRRCMLIIMHAIPIFFFACWQNGSFEVNPFLV